MSQVTLYPQTSNADGLTIGGWGPGSSGATKDTVLNSDNNVDAVCPVGYNSGAGIDYRNPPSLIGSNYGGNLHLNAQLNWIRIYWEDYIGEIAGTMPLVSEIYMALININGGATSSTKTHTTDITSSRAVKYLQWNLADIPNAKPEHLIDSDFGVIYNPAAITNASSNPMGVLHVDYLRALVDFTNPTYNLSVICDSYINLNQEFVYSITLTNTNNIHNGYPIPLSIVLPAGITYISQTGNGEYNTSTGKWNAVINNGTATLNLTLKPTTTGTKTINASIDGFSTVSTTNLTVYNESEETDITITGPDLLELTVESEYTLNIMGNIYDTKTHQFLLTLPDGVSVTSTEIVSSTNLSNINYSSGIISAKLTNVSIFAYTLSMKIKLSSKREFEDELFNISTAGGAQGNIPITADLTDPPLIYGTKLEIADPSLISAITSQEYNILGYTDEIQLKVSGSKTSMETVGEGYCDVIYGFIGPIMLDRTHSVEGLKNSTTNDLITEEFKNAANVGKKGNYKEELPLKIRLPRKDALTLQGLIGLDEPVPINTNVGAKDADPLNHRGYAVIYDADIGFLNGLRYDCDIKLYYISRNLNPPIYINRLGQINKYNLKPLYDMETMNESMDLEDYFNMKGSGTLTGKTITLDETDNFILTGKERLSCPATIQYSWNTTTLMDVERIIRILDDDENILFEYMIYTTGDDIVEEMIIYGSVSVFDTEDGADTDEWEIELEESSITTLHIDGNIVSILEEGASGAEIYVESLVLQDGNYTLQVELNHASSTTSSTTVDFNIDETHLLVDEKDQYINMIVSSFPLPGKTLLFTRRAEDGVLYYYRHDETVSKYYAQPFVIYKGGTDVVKEDGGSVLDNRYNLDPIGISNGLVKVMFSYRGKTANIYYYDHDSEEGWVWIDKLKLINMENITTKHVSQDKVIMSIGETIWTIYRGHHGVNVEHPEQDIYIDKINNIDMAEHDNGSGILTEEIISPETKTELSLNSLFYLLLHNDNKEYGLQIIRPDYAPIFNTIIPRNSKTVLIPYKKEAIEHDLPGQLAIQWLSMYEQKININGQ